MSRFALSQPLVRAAFCAFLLLLPVASAWNLAVAPSHPKLAIRIGRALYGVTYDTPIIVSWSSLRDGGFRKAVASRIAEVMPLRPFLIRLNNEIRLDLFGDPNPPQMLRGANGQLIERSYLEEYCARSEGMGATLAADIIPKLKQIQNHYRTHGGIFIYVISPSKAAHSPEYFVDRLPCPSTPAARSQMILQYAGALRQAGIDVVDTASLIHSLKGRYEVGLFPRGGIHWNDLGAATAVSAIVEAINRQAGREIVPPFTFTYAFSEVPGGTDHDLVDLLNVFFPPLGYPTPKVSFSPSASCADQPARGLDAMIVGSSFSHQLARILINDNCLSGLNLYFYARRRFGDAPYRELQRNLDDPDLERLRDAKIMIVEENESLVARSDYVNQLLAVVNRR
jgi:alginate O-acetyltransferase complex protein AlgJ